ncbi:MAG: CPBP family intramembrane metalloprotease [Oscillatoriaceae bacterium SKW80]|nr:CPBP family intramembrane metalloprotease [Oscillatoriaceae bacterium SKYG93]MCX8120800.1 CPBP family intramembrane metalloprotease [Oscillatoriaceae bacterium SKW80]MDW8453714.1 type II CAAX endopeptidase family protein [Oscillatoriaceae cyanobacterium SKYGB_i_bin93]HIK27693.1 CPBP family intramembrane metalloprotease [Oscillatoriaceae cyanobacterium M7585_C2015_266]
MTLKQKILQGLPTLKRLILSGLTILALSMIGTDLIQSLNQPQIQSRLELYQVNLVLHAAEWRGNAAGYNLDIARQTIFGDDIFFGALKQYQQTRKITEKSAEKIREQLRQLEEKATPQQLKQLQALLSKQETLLDEFDLRLGILQIQQNQTASALTTWANLKDDSTPLTKTAEVLVALWSESPRILPNSETLIQRHLDGWFRYRALSRLYEIQKNSQALAALQAEEQKIAKQAAVKLAIVGVIPVLGCLIGTGLIIFVIIQWLLKRKKSLLAQNADVVWETPWNGETVWLVFVVGFFFVGQVVIPFLLSFFSYVLNFNPAALEVRSKALYILASYILFAAGALLILYISVKPFLPLPEGWFRIDWRGEWFWWGLGGYLAALPLVIIVSIINQRIWEGQGGSNPILPIALEGRDGVALALFFITASMAAPVFEEIMFRGFLLPSLTRYVPMWGAITLSSLLFAIAHLSVSEVLPLATLGGILGFIYVRSRNLLAPMLLHSLWNSGTLLSLFILGSDLS